MSTLLVGIRLCARGDNFTWPDSPSLSGHLQTMIVLQSQENVNETQVYHVDAFTSQPFRGNSAGVVFPADNLSEAQMQLIARELGHSETAFLLHSDDSDVRIRYFTPTVEVPICGHATVAAHYVRAKVLGLGNCTVWQTSLAGKHRVTIEKHRWLSYFAGTRYARL